MKKKLFISIILILCFVLGFSLPYLYNNYGQVIINIVMGNGNNEAENTLLNDNEKEVQEVKVTKEVIDFTSVSNKAKKEFYDENYNESLELYIYLYDNNYNVLETLKNIIILSEYSNNNKEKVYSILDNNYQNYENSLEYNYYYGKYLYESGKYEQAKRILDHFTTLLNENTDTISSRKVAVIYNYLGDIYKNENKNEKALEQYKKGIDYNKFNVLNYLAAAEIYKDLNDFNKAIKMYQETLVQDHSLSEIYYELAILYEKTGEIEKAYHYWDRCLNSGVNTDIARDRIVSIREDYPQYFKVDQPDIKPVTTINWFEVRNIEANKHYPQIKIGLQDNIDRLRFQSKYDFLIKQDNNILFKGKSNTQYQINYNNHVFYVLRDSKILKTFSTNKQISISSESKNNLFALYDIRFAQNYFWGGVEDRQYRGDIYLTPINNKYVNIINYLDLTSYLLSVVPSEMPASWPKEALKAQSVVARSYILKNINRHKNEAYDMCASVHCIVYNGVKNENTNTTESVLETKNEVLTYEGKIIDAVFSSNSGGYTEASENVWGNKFEYLKAVDTTKDSNYNFPLMPYKLEEWFIEDPDSYSKNSYTTQSGYRWIKKVNINELKEKHSLDYINDINVTKRTTTGTVNEVKIIGNKTVTITNNSIRSGLTGLKSNKFIIKKMYHINDLKEIIIFGAGWGHSVGMDQTAAAGMAVEGKNYKEIVRFFFPNTKLIKLN